ATCGTGCRGDYSVSVPYSVDHEQRGTVEVYESSAKDGSAVNVVDIPVTLTP
ncbi:MAG TPA: Gmad2 immunoglobulin-like domain-containing protein, partial [Actinomycetota bacterium]